LVSKFSNNKINIVIAMMIVFCMLVIQSPVPVLAITDIGNIGPTTPSLSLAKQRKVTIQIDRGSSGYSDSYVQDRIYAVLKPILDAQKIELDARVRSISTIDTIVNSTAFSDDSENFYVSLNNSGYSEFSDATKSVNILNLFAEKQVTFIGMGNASNKAQIDSFIAKNQGNGTYIDNSYLDAALSRLADYVLGRTSIALDLFVGEGANQDKAVLQGKIDSIVKPKLAAANIDGDINIKMLRKEVKNDKTENFYFLNNYPYYYYQTVIPVGLYEYSITEHRWNTLSTHPSISNSKSLNMAYNGDLYYISADNNMYVYNFSTKQVKLCSNTSGIKCLASAINGKIYWTKNISIPSSDNVPQAYSQIYEYDPVTDTNRFVTATTPLAYFNRSREIKSIGVTLDLKLIYYYTYNDTSRGDFYYSLVLGGYNLKNNTRIVEESTSVYTFGSIKDYSEVLIMPNNKLVVRGKIALGGQFSSVPSIYSMDISDYGFINPYSISSSSKLDLKGGGRYIYTQEDEGSRYYYSRDLFIEGSVDHIVTNSGRETVLSVTPTGYAYITQQGYLIAPEGLITWPDSSYQTSLNDNISVKYPIINTPLITINSFDTELQNKVVDESKDSYIAYLGDANLPELSDYSKKVSIANKLKSGNSRFIGLGTATNQAQFQDLIAWNNNRGTFYDNSNLDVALNNLADNIIANTHKTDRSLQGYVAISEGSEIIATEEGALDTSGLPLYSATNRRSKDYVDVTGGSSYNFTTSEPVNNFNIYWYTSTLQFISKSNYPEPPTNLIVPSNATYAKVVFNSYSSNVQVTLINNTESSGDNLTYSSSASDIENDDLAYLYKYTHDPSKIAGVTIDNPSDKIAFNDTEISVPIKKFTKPGTYTISMRAKDIPKKLIDTENILPNGDAESVNADGSIEGWSSWKQEISSVTFTRRTNDPSWTIAGSGSFEMLAPQGADQVGVYYTDVKAAALTSYTLTGLIGAHRCQGYMYVDAKDVNGTTIQTWHTNWISNSFTPQESSTNFETPRNTASLRVHIVKSGSIVGGETHDYLFADNIKLLANKNLIQNSDAELINTDGAISGWSTWRPENSSATFTRRTNDPSWTVSGTASFEINASQSTSNIGIYYKDMSVSPNTSYTFSGLMGAHRCSGVFYIQQLDNSYNPIGGAIASNLVIDSYTVQSRSITFTTGMNTNKIRLHIQKGDPTYANNLDYAYIFADNLTLIKNIIDQRFPEYRKLSSSVSATIYAHRLPRANFSFQVSTNAGAFSIQNLADNGLSYDPDHLSRADKGIIDRQWRWAEVSPTGETTWHDGPVPNSQIFAAGSQILLWYRVRDTDGPGGKGAWSKPKMQRVDGQLVNPVALFLALPNSVPIQNSITFSDQSYSRNLNGVITSRVWTIRKVGATSADTLTFTHADLANNKYYKDFTNLGFGSFIVSLTVTDSYGRVSNPYSQTVNIFDNLDPTVSVSPVSGTFTGVGGATVTVTCNDSALGNTYNRGLKTIEYVWSKNATVPQTTDTVQIINIPTEGVYTISFTASQTLEGTWYLYVKDKDYAGNTNSNGAYVKFGPYNIETLKAAHFYITMMLDVGWRSYYFDVDNGIDDDHDGEVDRYPRLTSTDIGSLKMPINYFNLVGHTKTYIKAGYKVKGKIDIIGGDPEWAGFDINYIINGQTYTDNVTLTKAAGDTYNFEWIIPLETDTKTFVCFSLVIRKGGITYGNEKWIDNWDARNTSKMVFYVKGKATDDLIYVQSQ